MSIVFVDCGAIQGGLTLVNVEDLASIVVGIEVLEGNKVVVVAMEVVGVLVVVHGVDLGSTHAADIHVGSIIVVVGLSNREVVGGAVLA